MDSPLDPFLASFLQLVQAGDAGYVPGPQAKRLAEHLNVQTAFVEALYVSARTRGLMKPSYRRAGKMHWEVSDTGTALINRFAVPPDTASSATPESAQVVTEPGASTDSP